MMIQIRWASMKDPVVTVDDLKAWLRGKYRTAMSPAPDAGYHRNALIWELLQEIEDAEKEGL